MILRKEVRIHRNLYKSDSDSDGERETHLDAYEKTALSTSWLYTISFQDFPLRMEIQSSITFSLPLLNHSTQVWFSSPVHVPCTTSFYLINQVFLNYSWCQSCSSRKLESRIFFSTFHLTFFFYLHLFFLPCLIENFLEKAISIADSATSVSWFLLFKNFFPLLSSLNCILADQEFSFSQYLGSIWGIGNILIEIKMYFKWS